MHRQAAGASPTLCLEKWGVNTTDSGTRCVYCEMHSGPKRMSCLTSKAPSGQWAGRGWGVDQSLGKWHESGVLSPQTPCPPQGSGLHSPGIFRQVFPVGSGSGLRVSHVQDAEEGS